MIDYAQMGKRIKQRRKELHLTQDALADQVGISISFMGHIERGSRSASLETLLALCIALDVSMDYIIGHRIAEQDKTLSVTLTEDECNACREALTILLDKFKKAT